MTVSGWAPVASGERRGLGAHEGHGADCCQRAQELQEVWQCWLSAQRTTSSVTGRSLKGHSAGDVSHDVRSISPTWGPRVMVVGR